MTDRYERPLSTSYPILLKTIFALKMSKIPKIYNNLREDFPEVGKVYHNFGEAVTNVRSLDDKNRALVKSAMFLGAQKECDVHPYTEILSSSCIKEEFYKVIL